MKLSVLLIATAATLMLLPYSYSQQLTVSAALFSPLSTTVENLGGDSIPVLALHLEAQGGAATLDTIEFVVDGTADVSTALSASVPGTLWLDDGDGVFSDSTDTLLASGNLSGSQLAFVLQPALNIASAAIVDLWVVLNVSPNAGNAKNDTLVLTLASANAVGASVPVVLTPSSPIASETLTVLQFSVTAVTPNTGHEFTKFEIVGTGFSSPVIVRMGGVECRGALDVSSDGTVISDIMPPRFLLGGTYPMTIETGILGERSITQVFHKRINFGGPDIDESQRCSLGDGRGVPKAPIVLMCMAFLVYGWRRRGYKRFSRLSQ